jgi:hypothetical protein
MDGAMPTTAQTRDFRSFIDQVESERLCAVARHWDQARIDGQMPSFAQLRPATIAAQLPIIWVYSYDRAARCFIGRLAGDRITQGFGKSFRGLPVEELHPPEHLPRVLEVLNGVLEGPNCYRSGGQLFRKAGMPGFGERIILPLAEDGVNPDGVLGASDYQFVHGGQSAPVESIGEDERWFALD